MKRIDDKIKEIEKKDKSSRILYIAFIGVILIAMGIILSQIKGINERDDIISDNEIELIAKNKELKKQRDSISDAYKELNNSLRPNEYWEYIVEEKSVEAYIDYITNEWGIGRPQENLVQAYETMHSSKLDPELVGWLYIGQLNRNNEFTDRKNRTKIVWPASNTGKIPAKNDILKLTYRSNMTTYKKPSTGGNRYKNDEGWRPGTKAFVVETYHNLDESNNFFVKIKYY